VNPWPIVAAAVVFLGGFGIGWKAQSDHRDALELAAKQGRDEALEAAAKEIAKIEVKQITINRKLEREVRENVVYRDCRHTPDAVRLLNNALQNRAEPAGDGKLP
jgi:hypothetical protein